MLCDLKVLYCGTTAGVFNPDQAIRCTQQGCSCECFAPGKTCLRYCDGCNHGWVAHALDKLGYQHLYLGVQVEVVQPNIVFDIASLMLYGAQATPVRLKILLDRLFSVLQHEEVLQVLHGFGWSYEDYARGYILQDNNGRVLDKWNMATRDEEHVILQQFLRFGETKAIAQEIILQDTRDRQEAYSKQTTRAESEIKKFIERSNLSMQNLMKLQQQQQQQQQHHQQQQQQDPARHVFASRGLGAFVPGTARILTSPISLTTASPYSPSRDGVARPLSLTTPATSAVPPMVTPPISRLQAFEFRRDLIGGGVSSTPASASAIVAESKTNVAVAAAVAAAAAAAAAAATNSPISLPTVVSSLAAQQAVQQAAAHQAVVVGRSRSPVMDTSSPRHLSATPSSMHSGTSPCVTPHKMTPMTPSGSHQSGPDAGELSGDYSGGESGEDDDDDDDSNNEVAIDYSTRDSESPHGGGGGEGDSGSLSDRKSAAAAAAARHARKSTNPVKRQWIPSANFGSTLIGPNGKKRVLCTACNKTFCDKGALKIHYSAVHLKEMHKCTVEGCNMMFSSRRSRNRHSANPNPKLHMPQKRKELEGVGEDEVKALTSLSPSSSSQSLVVSPSLVAAHRSLEAAAGGLLRPEQAYFLELGAQFPFVSPPPEKRIKLEGQDDAPTDLSSSSGNNNNSAALDRARTAHLGDAGIDMATPASRDQQQEADVRSESRTSPPLEAASALHQTEDAALTEAGPALPHQSIPAAGEAGEAENAGQTSADLSSQRAGNRRKSNAPTRLAQNLPREETLVSVAVSAGDELRHRGEPDATREREEELSGATTPEGVGVGDEARRAETAKRSAPESTRLQQLEECLGGAERPEVRKSAGAIHFPQIASLLLGSREQQRALRDSAGNDHGLGDDHSEDDDDDDSGSENELVINGDVDNDDEEVEEDGKDGEEEDRAMAVGDVDDNDHNHNNVAREGDGEVGECDDDLPSPTSDGGDDRVASDPNRELYLSKDNPRKCALCGKLFHNQFSVKIHFQNVHLKLMHGCTVEGCTAAFPSRRSRDRHSSNLNLHRKLVQGEGAGLGLVLGLGAGGADPTLRQDILSTLYGAGLAAAASSPSSAPLNLHINGGGGGERQAVGGDGGEEEEEEEEAEVGDGRGPSRPRAAESRAVGVGTDSGEEQDGGGRGTELDNASHHGGKSSSNSSNCLSHSAKTALSEEPAEQDSQEEVVGKQPQHAAPLQEASASSSAEREEPSASKAADKPAVCASRKPVCCGMTFHTESALREHYRLSHPTQSFRSHVASLAASDTLLSSRRPRVRTGKNYLPPQRLVSTGRKNGFS